MPLYKYLWEVEVSFCKSERLRLLKIGLHYTLHYLDGIYSEDYPVKRKMGRCFAGLNGSDWNMSQANFGIYFFLC